jgi:hypothetical protein
MPIIHWIEINGPSRPRMEIAIGPLSAHFECGQEWLISTADIRNCTPNLRWVERHCSLVPERWKQLAVHSWMAQQAAAHLAHVVRGQLTISEGVRLQLARDYLATDPLLIEPHGRSQAR